MPNDMLVLNLDLGLGDLSQFSERMQQEMAKVTAKLTLMTHRYIQQQARSKLKSTLQIFLDALQPPESLDLTTWVISLDKKAMWIEEGLKPDFDMLQGFIASPKAKTGKKGKYLVIPFKHNKQPAVMTPTESVLNQAVRKFLETSGPNGTPIPYGSLEKNSKGKTLTGRLHTFNLTTPNRMHTIPVGSQGAEGQPWQIHAKPTGQEGPGGRPFLWGLNIYQKEKTDKNGKLTGAFQKDMMTFRTASESQAGKGMWLHPGLEGKKLFDSALQWASHEWDTKIKNDVLKALGLT